MEHSRNGVGGKVVTFEETITGRHRNGSIPSYLDIGRRDVDAAGRAVRPLQQPQGAASRRRTYADGELDVFSAERYFKGAIDGVYHRNDDAGGALVAPPPPLEMAAAESAARPFVVVAKPVGTRASVASVSSATSANSRTTLLRRRRERDHRDNKKCCVHVGALMRSCSGKRSVRVDSGVMAKEEVPGAGEPAPSKIDWYKELRMQKAALGLAPGDGSSNHGVVAATTTLPPNLNLGAAKVAAIGRHEVIREDKPAEFTSSSGSNRRRSFTLVAPVRANNVAANGRVGDAGGGGGNEDDDDDGAGSESSSDLFEIKSLMIDDYPYEPSEASIQWSVATADASERGDRVSARWVTGGGNHRGRGPPVGRRQNRDRPPAGLLSGCVSHRAVEVSAVTRTAVPHAPRRRGEGFQKAPNGA